MDVVITLEHRFDRTADGAVWTQAAFARSFYSQYLDVFENVRVVARVRNVKEPLPGARRADGTGVYFHPVPYYVGPRDFLLRAHQIRRALRDVAHRTDAVILRVGSNIAALMEPAIRRMERPYALEVLGDPYEAFAPGCTSHPLRSLFRLLFYWQLRRQCARAPAVAYCTAEALQRRYPAARNALRASYSDVELPADAFVSSPRVSFGASGVPINLVTVGSLEMLYKGTDVLIEAAISAASAGLDLQMWIVGDGRYRGMLEAMARPLGDRIRFVGQVPSGAEGVRRYLDMADLFILPSRTEGLPRALLEAMARGLPCIASAVGGIPELLPRPDLVPPGDSKALAEKIATVLLTPGRMQSMSARSLETAQDYSHERLREKRNAFYRHLHQQTENWAARYRRESSALSVPSNSSAYRH